MRKHLQIALMASSVIATFLSSTTPQLQAQAGFVTAASITTATDDSGRKIYVNDEEPVTSGAKAIVIFLPFRKPVG